MPSKYKALWKEYDLNTDFWNEVLVGRTVQGLCWDEQGICGLILDNNEIVHIAGDNRRLYICDDDDKTKS